MRSVLNADILISGNVATTTEIHIDGHVLGDVNCGTLIQSGKGKIVGIVTADTARLAGSIQGTVRVRQLTVESGARINGDITYEQIAIEDGGLIEGRLKYMDLASPLTVDSADGATDTSSASTTSDGVTTSASRVTTADRGTNGIGMHRTP